MRKRIYVSTVARGAQEEDASRIYEIDCNTNKITGFVRLPLAMFDLANPRGGTRGARGMCFYQGKLYAAGFDGIFQIDKDMFIERGWWTKHNGIHQIYNKNNHIEYAATRHDQICFFNPETGCFGIKESLKGIHKGVEIVDDNRGNNDSLHFNSFADDYAFFNIVGAIASISKRQVLMKDMKYMGSHDLLILPTGELVMNQSRELKTIAFNTNTWQETRTLLQLPKTPKTEMGIATDGFLRGMSYIPQKDILLIGSAPASVYILYNASKRETNDQYQHVEISDKVVESVFDVIPHPDDW